MLVKDGLINSLLKKRHANIFFLVLTLVIVLAFRQLTFLPYNPIIDAFFNDDVVGDNNKIITIKDINSTSISLENSYPRPAYSTITNNYDDDDGQINGSSTKLIILLWTKFFGDSDWTLGIDNISRTPNCPLKNCYLANNRSFLAESSAVVFHFRDLHHHDQPQLRQPNQYWIFALFETPDHTYSGNHIKSRTSKRFLKTDYGDFFNWTMTYRRDSDITSFYGEFTKQITIPKTAVLESGFSKKTRTAVTLLSNCDTSSQRLEYIRELQRFIDVDVIGACSDSLSSHLADPYCRSKSENPDRCYNYLSKNYKFYLAFENSLCGDYVTEKFFRAASLGLVPVVFNGVEDMSQFGPPHSYINARDFASPKQLANHLKHIARSKELYDGYLWWKRQYDVEFTLNLEKAFCNICKKLLQTQQEPEKQKKRYTDIDYWWTKNDDGGSEQCHPGYVLPNQSFRNFLERISVLLIVILLFVAGTKLFIKMSNHCC